MAFATGSPTAAVTAPAATAAAIAGSAAPPVAITTPAAARDAAAIAVPTCSCRWLRRSAPFASTSPAST